MPLMPYAIYATALITPACAAAAMLVTLYAMPTICFACLLLRAAVFATRRYVYRYDAAILLLLMSIALPIRARCYGCRLMMMLMLRLLFSLHYATPDYCHAAKAARGTRYARSAIRAARDASRAARAATPCCARTSAAACVIRYYC